jgi:multisubunit Na+/H+ antiporter MnhB subunit
VVVEILCLVILIRATISRDLTAISGDREFFGMTVTVVLLIALALFSVKMFDQFPEFGSAVMDRIGNAPSVTYVEEGMERTGAPNIVTAVLLDFRAYDTLGEATVLFCAVLGALAVLRQKARKRREDEDKESDAA